MRKTQPQIILDHSHGKTIPLKTNKASDNGEALSQNIKVMPMQTKKVNSNSNRNLAKRNAPRKTVQSVQDVDSLSMSSASTYNSGGSDASRASSFDIANPLKKMPVQEDAASHASSGSRQSSVSKTSMGSGRSGRSKRSRVDNYANDARSSASTEPGNENIEDMQNSEREKINKEKQELLYKFHRLEQKGIHSSRRFNMKSHLDDMKMEYKKITRQISVEQSVKFQRRVLLAFASGVEFLNKRYDPFNVKLDGWSENIMENINDYDNVFERLSDKYSGSSEMSPEIELLFLLLSSGFMFHLTQTLFKTALPNMTDIAKQNPNLMQNLANAMMQNMNQKQAQVQPHHAQPNVQQVNPEQPEPEVGPPLPVNSRQDTKPSALSKALPEHMQPFDNVISSMMAQGAKNFMDPPSNHVNDAISIASDYEDASSASASSSDYSDHTRTIPVVTTIKKGGKKGKQQSINEVTLDV